MFGSDILDIAIGVIFVYLLFSLLITALREAIEAWLKTRSSDLERGLRTLLNDPTGKGLVAQLYKHPLIYSLFEGDYAPGTFHGLTGATKGGTNLPSYIPSRSFALALMDIMGGYGAPGGSRDPGPGFMAEHLATAALHYPDVARVIQLSLRTAGGDLEKVRADVEAWFDSGMDRVSGWYKRRTQKLILGLGFVLVVALNVNTLGIVRTLSQNTALRQVVVAQAGREAGSSASPAPSVASAWDAIERIGLPIGWGPGVMRGLETRFACHGGFSCWTAGFSGGLEILLGWLMTAFAISLGAPFWFDILSRIMTVRSTMKPDASGSSTAPPPAAAAPAPSAVAVAATLDPPDQGAPAQDPAARPRED